MGEFFGSMYCWLFEEFFGLELADYLWGTATELSTTNKFIGIGLWMYVATLFFTLVYYYLLDHPRIAKWWGWLTFMIANAIVNFIIGWQATLSDYYEGLMKIIDPATKKLMDLPIDEINCLNFGVSDAFVAMFWFFIISMIIKWWSKNSAHSPF